MDKLKLWMRASRFRVVPVMVMPVLLGGAAAFAWDGVFRPALFVITLLGAAAAHLFSNMVNDLWDHRNGVDRAAQETAATVSTNSGFLTRGTISETLFKRVTWLLLAIAAACGIALALFTDAVPLALGLAGGLIAYFYVAPPIKFGYRGKGYSELAIVLAFGVLPVFGAYYVQTQTIGLRPLLISLPVGLLTTLLLFNHHFLHWQADKLAGKRTLVVVWGETRAIGFSKALCAAAYAALIACGAAGALPWYGLAGLVTAFPLIRAYRGLQRTNRAEAYLPLMGASKRASVRLGAWMSVCLLIQGLL